MFAATLLSLDAAAGDDIDTRVSALFDKGNELFDRGRDAEAEAAFEEAWALRQTHDLAGNLAQAELAQGKHLEALEHLRYALDHMPAGASKKKRGNTEKIYAKALTGVSLLTLTVDPHDASIEVDGPKTVTIPEGLAVAPGERRVRVSKVGFVAHEEGVTVAAGERKELKVTLEADKTPPLAPTAATSSSVPGPTPSGIPPVREEPSLVPSLVAGGLGVALLGAGIGFRVVANNAESDAVEEQARLQNDQVSCANNAAACAGLNDAVNKHDSTVMVSDWLFVGAGVAAGAAVILWIWPLDVGGEESTQSLVVPSVSTAGAGVTWAGRF